MKFRSGYEIYLLEVTEIHFKKIKKTKQCLVFFVIWFCLDTSRSRCRKDIGNQLRM